MANTREMRLRIRSIKNISQVTRALQAVSASNVRKAMEALLGTRPYASKAWQVLTHISMQPGREQLHPLLVERQNIRSILVVLITGDRGLAGSYTSNIMRFTFQQFDSSPVPVRYVAVGRKGRDLLYRRRKTILAEFSSLPAAPTFADVSAIGRVAVDEFLAGNADEVYLTYTNFINMITQRPVRKKLLPLEVEQGEGRVYNLRPAEQGMAPTYIYEPGEMAILDEVIPRFTALQVYQAILESLASEHAARMVAMKNATDSAISLVGALQMQYNQVRQQSITSEMLDIVGGAEALK